MSTRQDPSVSHHGTEDVAMSARFARLRPARVLDATAFSTTLAAAHTRPRGSHGKPSARLVIAVAVAMPLVIAVVLQQRARAAVHADVALAREIGTLVAWRSPTESLLEPAYAARSWMLPSLHESVISFPVTPEGGIR